MAVGGSNRGALSFFSLSAWVRDGRGGRAVRHAVDAILACQDLDPPPSSLPWRRLDPPPSSLPWRRLYPDSSRRREAVAAPPRRNLRLLLRDAAEDDEAVAASALKSLGFALYHPVLVSTISGQLAQSVLATLVRLIMTTKMKAICNLAVWCISVQQLEASVVEDGVTPLLNGIVYALDNPFGSLSTTFEAVQGGKTNCS